MSKIKSFIRVSYIGNLISGLKRLYKDISFNYRKQLGYVHPTASVENPICFKNPQNVFLHEHTILRRCIVMTPVAKFVVKKYSGTAEGLVVLTGNHDRFVGKFYRTVKLEEKITPDKDVIIEEDCWVGVNVTLLPGVVIRRGSTIAAGAVVTKSTPPYSLSAGVPCRFLKFYWTIDQILEHESKLYPEEERFTREQLEYYFAQYPSKK